MGVLDLISKWILAIKNERKEDVKFELTFRPQEPENINNSFEDVYHRARVEYNDDGTTTVVLPTTPYDDYRHLTNEQYNRLMARGYYGYHGSFGVSGWSGYNGYYGYSGVSGFDTYGGVTVPEERPVKKEVTIPPVTLPDDLFDV